MLMAFLLLDIYNIRAKNKETSRLLNQADEAAEVGVLVQSIRLIQNNAREDLEAFEELALSDSKIVPLIESIEKAGQSLGVKTEIASVEKTDEPQQLNLIIETEGSWAGTLSFLKAIESLPHRVMVKSVNVSKDESLWSATIALSLYLFN